MATTGTTWTELGGSPDLAHLAETIADHFDLDIHHKLFVENPARFLWF